MTTSLNLSTIIHTCDTRKTSFLFNKMSTHHMLLHVQQSKGIQYFYFFLSKGSNFIAMMLNFTETKKIIIVMFGEKLCKNVLLQPLIDKIGQDFQIYTILFYIHAKNPKFIQIVFNYNKYYLLIKHFDIFLKISLILH